MNTPLCRRFLSILASALFLLHSTANVSAGKPTVTYDLNANWSDTRNPNGAWSYNWGNDPISIFQTFWWGQAGWGFIQIGDGCIIKGSYFDGQTDPWGTPIGPAHDWQPGDVMMHALSIPYGGRDTFVNIKWTSPGDGMIDIAGRAWDGEIFSDRDVAWKLIVAGNVIAQRSSVIGLYRDDSGAQFSENLVGKNSLSHIKVNYGDVVEFRVITDTYYGHFVGIEEQITFKAK